jgi:sugar O-acyltransferase (sialic acid O-acetyltransferase NeuD family)
MNLVIMGTGGLASESLEWIQQEMDLFSGIQFYADFSDKMELFRIPIVTTLDDLEGKYFLTAVGDPKLKYKFYEKAINKGLIPCNPLITKRTTVARSALLRDNTIIAPNATITSRVCIGHSATIHYGCTIGHDCNIGDYFTALPGCNISGNVSIGHMVTVGANACIREKITIADKVFIGMGAVVVKDIKEAGVYVGNPARKLIK